jgi:hypothetical protein
MKLKLIECNIVRFTKIGPHKHAIPKIVFIYGPGHHLVLPINSYKHITVKL